MERDLKVKVVRWSTEHVFNFEESMWWFRDQQQVRYEWYTETFLPVIIPLMDWAVDRALAGFSAISRPQLMTPSPTVRRSTLSSKTTEIPRTPNKSSGTKFVKIGQTALHDPGGIGLSSWRRLWWPWADEVGFYAMIFSCLCDSTIYFVK